MSENYQELPSGWVSAPLGSFTDILGGSTPSRKETRYFGGEIVWLTPTEIPKETVSVISNSKEMLTEEGFKESGVRWIPSGSVLLTSRASIGYVAIAGVKLTTNQGFASFVLPKEIDPKYLGWWLRSQKAALEDLAKGTTFKEISKTTLRDVLAPIAPLNEQHRIVAAIEQQFSRLDAAVASLQHAKTKLKRERAAILKAAIEGTLTEKWREEHHATEFASQLLERILKERRARWEADQLVKMRVRGVTPKDDTWKKGYKEPEPPDTTVLPELPEEWVWASMEQLADIIGGVTKGRNLASRLITTLPYLRVANVQRGFLDLSIMKTIEVPQDEVEKYLLHNGDVVLTEGGDADKLGRAALWQNQITQCIHQNHIFRARLVNQNMPPLWLVFCANSEQGQSYFLGAAKQTVNLASINLTQLRHCPVPLPPLSEQQQIVSEVEERLSIIAQTEVEVEANLKRAGRLRQTILAEALAGRLVPQYPDDEPASVLLERIGKERRERKNGKGSNGRFVKVSNEPVRMDVEGVEQVRLWERALTD